MEKFKLVIQKQYFFEVPNIFRIPDVTAKMTHWEVAVQRNINSNSEFSKNNTVWYCQSLRSSTLIDRKVTVHDPKAVFFEIPYIFQRPDFPAKMTQWDPAVKKNTNSNSVVSQNMTVWYFQNLSSSTLIDRKFTVHDPKAVLFWNTWYFLKFGCSRKKESMTLQWRKTQIQTL